MFDTATDTKMEILSPNVMEGQERAAIDMMIATAKKYPRDLTKVKQKMLAYATLDQETAAACFYTLKRKDADGSDRMIEGPSVRLAEIAVGCYGNLRASARIVDNDGRKITCQGICMDLESNVAVSIEVTRRITTKLGKTFSDDMQAVTGNAGNAIAFRNAVFKVIPGALFKPVYEEAKRAAVGQGPVLQKWQKAIRAFAGWNVNEQELLWFVGKNAVGAVDDEDIAKLIGLFNSLRDGETKVEEAFADLRNRGSAEAAQAVAEEKLRATEPEKQQAETAQEMPAGPDVPAQRATNGGAAKSFAFGGKRQ